MKIPTKQVGNKIYINHTLGKGLSYENICRPDWAVKKMMRQLARGKSDDNSN